MIKKTSINQTRLAPVSIDAIDLLFGPENVLNGAFPTDTVWTKESGWSIGSGVASYDGTDESNSIHQDMKKAKVGTVYTITFDAVVNQGAIGISDGVTTLQSGINSSGSKSYEYMATGTEIKFNAERFGGVRFIGTIDNVSIREKLANV
jgi:hypothetical protein